MWHWLTNLLPIRKTPSIFQRLRNYPLKHKPLWTLITVSTLALMTMMLLTSASVNDLTPMNPTKPLTMNTTELQPSCVMTTSKQEPSAYEPKKSKASTDLVTDKEPSPQDK
uniref:Female-specific orf protein n=1 Tax=Margaritifera margaritifera TaxID=102329 RepID=F4ZFH5_PINMG|nr:female-specific orf protein [Pinctada margaritifera]AEC14059.1 female-specific orf protein [Pinctada margaritifera]